MTEKKVYPNIPVSHWHKLRIQFKKSIPGSVTPNYAASVLGMTENSAKVNIIPSLKLIGMIDENDNTNLEMAKKFRDDEQYKELCAEIINHNYPREVHDAFPDSNSDRGKIKTWFMNHTGIGSSGANRYVAFYVALLAADTSYEVKTTKPSTTRKSKPTPTHSDNKKDVGNKEKSESQTKGNNSTTSVKSLPGLNINIQIHISSDATPDQIEQIFKSMSNHIYKN